MYPLCHHHPAGDIPSATCAPVSPPWQGDTSSNLCPLLPPPLSQWDTPGATHPMTPPPSQAPRCPVSPHTHGEEAGAALGPAVQGAGGPRGGGGVTAQLPVGDVGGGGQRGRVVAGVAAVAGLGGTRGHPVAGGAAGGELGGLGVPGPPRRGWRRPSGWGCWAGTCRTPPAAAASAGPPPSGPLRPEPRVRGHGSAPHGHRPAGTLATATRPSSCDAWASPPTGHSPRTPGHQPLATVHSPARHWPRPPTHPTTVPSPS